MDYLENWKCWESRDPHVGPTQYKASKNDPRPRQEAQDRPRQEASLDPRVLEGHRQSLRAGRDDLASLEALAVAALDHRGVHGVPREGALAVAALDHRGVHGIPREGALAVAALDHRGVHGVPREGCPVTGYQLSTNDWYANTT